MSDYDFELPPELIAQFPLPERTASRLLRVTADALEDLRFSDVERLLRPGDVLVMNDTRVIKARLRGRKPTGGAVEAMIERVTGESTAISMLRASKTPKAGSELVFEKDGRTARAVVGGRRGQFFELAFDEPVLAVLERLGHVPLPPYIARGDDEGDEERYQTVYAERPGAVAAPTAGLHFSEELLARLRARGVEERFVTLHVGAGTFQPVREENLENHRMHSEWFSVPPETAEAVNRAKREGRRVVAVGSTSLRALESAAEAPGAVAAGARDTRLFIAPGYRFRVIDVMITNFHLPKSTLVMLISAILGRDRVMQAYRHAVASRYRFFSYGDACFLELAAGQGDPQP
ncbi:MAG: tRNA preQ1(34) S-adenosylmethionine ribosyltransferase-isomerase QueA [Duodenibacillus sp.]|nr:tRNA preQ1(34) S-adenosylmethionine ribosyltransferase-isomerase QueA [Duodenibacillus sp.]